MNKEVEILVVGAGPAGCPPPSRRPDTGRRSWWWMKTASPAGSCSSRSTSFFGSRRHHAGVRGVDIGTELLAEVEALGVEVMLNTVAYGVYPHDEGVALAVNGKPA